MGTRCMNSKASRISLLEESAYFRYGPDHKPIPKARIANWILALDGEWERFSVLFRQGGNLELGWEVTIGYHSGDSLF